MKKTLLTLAALLGVATGALADEGMWILSLLSKHNIDVMRREGCRLTPDEIYSVNHGSIKDAVVIFGGGCTGEIVSDNGLIFTNHHCGYSSIQQLSSVEHNYLRDGFWAKSFDEDLPVDGLQVRFLKSFEDVTDKVMEGVTDKLSPEARVNLIKSHRDQIAREAVDVKDGSVEASVESFFGGNQYFLIKYDVFNDVRLVGTPPESIGKFGHDTDNWQWPRHTGDFSIFRVYAGKDNKPASFSPDNKPYKPQHFLPVSVKGMKKGDFAMTIGYPGSTDRYATSWDVITTRDIENASRIEPRDIKQKIWLEDMLADQAIYIKYASKYSRSTNYYKNSIGMNRGIDNLNVIGRKELEQQNFQKWVKKNGSKLEKKVLRNLEKLSDKLRPYDKASSYWYECLWGGPEIFRFAYRVSNLAAKSDTAGVIEAVRAFYKDYSLKTDRRASAALLAYYSSHIDKAFQPKFMAKLHGDKAFSDLIDGIFAESCMADSSKLIAAASNGDFAQIKDDVAVRYATQMVDTYNEDIVRAAGSLSEQQADARRIYMAARMRLFSKRDFYSDANFTMRLSYGQVGGYTTADTTYGFFTDLDGVMAKEDPTNWEFVVDPKLKQLYNAKDFGRYADKDGKMHVCFITNNDITGGNSGSPVINGDGELIGLAFDGNWEAMSGDIIFEPTVQRCICVDVRYVLFVIDKIGGAQNIIDELAIKD